MSSFELLDITFYYSKYKPVLKDLYLKAESGELLALLGESGSGKTTLLKIIAGFLKPQKGKIIIDGKDHTNTPPHKREIGIVFQNYALFPHMTVLENIIYGLKVRHVPKTEALKMAYDLLEQLDIKELADRYPSQLSGGQQQRVAIARALVIRPKILLMDEPLSNIDPKLRSKVRTEIKRIQREFRITTIYVTHDQEDAFEIGDKIAVLHDGKIERVDKPVNILLNPETSYVASFIGYENIIPLTEFRRHFKDLEWVLKEKEGYSYVGIRASNLKLSHNHVANNNLYSIEGRVLLKTYKKEYIRNIVKTPIAVFEVHTFEDLFSEGDAVYVIINKKDMVFLK